MSLTTPFSVQKLPTALHAKAKEAPKFRFYALYDKVYRKDVLTYAYERCEANGGTAGVDEQTFEDIEKYSRERWLDELMQELKSRTYQPQPVRRVYIPKPDVKQRPLGIPTIRARMTWLFAVAPARLQLLRLFSTLLLIALTQLSLSEPSFSGCKLLENGLGAARCHQKSSKIVC